MNINKRSPSRRRNCLRRDLAFEPLEDRALLAGDPILGGEPVIISEFSADNNSALFTRTRLSTGDAFEGEADSPDWIELLNVSGQRLDVSGMHLTDDDDAPTKWAFPTGTSIDAGGYLVVLATGNDIRDASLDEYGRLHTNFRLSASGEYLALTSREGEAVHEYAPTYPAQRTDVSYSVPMQERTLIGPEAAIEYLVPTDDSLDSQWLMPVFADPKLIGVSGGDISPIGYDRGDGAAEVGETIGAEELISRPTVDFARGSLVVLESMPFTAAGRVGEWSFYSETTRPITPLALRAAGDDFEIVGVGRTRTSDGSGTQSYEFDLQSGSDVVEPTGYYFGFKDGDNQMDVSGVIGWSRSDSDTVRRYNGPLSGSVVVGQQLSGGRAFDRTFSVQATMYARLTGPFNTDVESAMTGATSVYVRYPFEAGQLDTMKTLALHIRYDDGFVAYMNGTEVARRNVPDSIRFDSTAASNRAVKDANRFEEINISQFLGELQDGDNVLALHGFNDAVGGADFLIDARLVGFDIPSVAGVGFASDPTPGRANEAVFREFARAPTFSHRRGLYDEAFTLELTTPEMPGATIYITSDGTSPTPDNPDATVYQQPLEVDSTAVYRAASYQDELLPSLPQTHTYIFPDNVIDQNTMQPAITEDPVWGPQLKNALTALPTISLMTADSISVGAEARTSVEMIFPDGTEGFQIDAGVEPTGGTSLAFAKQTLRLSFKKSYGSSTLDFDLFDDPDGVTQFDQLLLRAGAQDSLFVSDPSVGGSSYIRNRWAYDRQREMGQSAPRGRFIHLYLNGTYWGMYELVERPNAGFMASIFGGEKSDYDVLNAGTPIGGAGDDGAWNALIDAVDDGYDAIQNYLDVENYADYMLLQFFGGNDWDWRADFNWIAARRREPGSGFQFFAWDSDNVLRRGAHSDIVNYGGPGFLWTKDGGVQQYPAFLQMMAERAQSYFYDSGMFSDERLRTDIDAIAAEIEVAMIAETSRWGSGLYTPDTWLAAIDGIKETYAPENGLGRAATVIEQMRHAGLFPLSDRPDFSTDGRPLDGDRVAGGAELAMSAPEGVIYYTFDGSDPWERTPSVQYTALIAESTTAHVFVPPDDSLRTDWLARGFDDSDWTRGETGVGFDTTEGFGPLIGLNIQDQMKDANATAYLRIPFQVDDLNQFDTLEFSIRYDDGFVAYLNGVEVARRNAPETPAWNSTSSGSPRPNEAAIEFENFNLSRVRHLLEPGENVLAIHALNTDPGNVDLLMTPMLRAGEVTDAGVSPTAIRYSGPITVPSVATIKARTLWGDQWSTLRETATATTPSPLRISEIMYHPADPTESEQAAGFTDADDFEFIELSNISNASIDLAGVRFVQTNVGRETEGIGFDFRDGAIRQLGPGLSVLVVEDEAAFRVRYGSDLQVAGQWNGGLSNSSETVTLMDAETIVQQITYSDAWYAQTDGQGHSLEIVDVLSTPLDEFENLQRWRASQAAGGTPGRVGGAVVRPGDANGDGVFDEEDLAQLLAAGKYMTGETAAFEQGDFNGDGVFDSHDIVDALVRGDFQLKVMPALKPSRM